MKVELFVGAREKEAPEVEFKQGNESISIVFSDKNTTKLSDEQKRKLAMFLLGSLVLEPSEKDWNVWSEGYVATGESAPAKYHGSARALTFKEAVIKVFRKKDMLDEYFDEKNLTYWSCRIYDNEEDARKAFG